MRLIKLSVTGFIFALAGITIGCALRLTRWTVLRPHVQVGDRSFGRLRMEELSSSLEPINRVLNQIEVEIPQVAHRRWTLAQWGIELDVLGTAAAAREAWQKAPLIARLLGKSPIKVQPVWRVQAKVFNARLQALRFLECEARDARVVWRNEQVVILPEQTGRRLDPEQTYQNLLLALHQISLQNPPSTLPLALGFRAVEPRYTCARLKPIRGVIGRYTTRFPGYQVNRNHNIRLAAQALDGVMLLPGEQLSYNQRVGRRTRRNGFRVAPVIIRGEKRLGIGGGVCQVSSTLYNAALLADLKIVRRSNHSLPIPYVPLGRDATVTEYLDLVIENSHNFPVVFLAEVGRSSLTVRVLGAPFPQRRVQIRTERLGFGRAPVRYVKVDYLPPGVRKVLQKGSPGVRVRTWRLIYEGGRLIRRERISTSIYRAKPRVIAVGVAPKSV